MTYKIDFETAAKIADMYLEKFPRAESYAVKLTSSYSDSEWTTYHLFTPEEQETLRKCFARADVAILLKFSSFNRGERRAAEHQVRQSQKYYESALMQVHMEAAQAYNSARAASDVLRKYDATMLQDARDIVESRKVGYQQGESSLVEFLAAQQTYREVMQAYVEACCNQFMTQKQLEAAIGVTQ